MNIEIIESGDGSHTLLLPHLKETYHSLHGAIQESEYVFIEKGLVEAVREKTEVTVLEIGFGTGLNALLCLQFALRNKIKINYVTLEPFPLPEEIYKALNYIDLLKTPELKDDFWKMHNALSGEKLMCSDLFEFKRFQKKLEDFVLPGLLATIVFYDAFAPGKQPEVWCLDNLKKVKNFMDSKGILVTYCAMGQFKRDLKEAGFSVETLQGPPGKKEMTRGFLL